MKSILLTASTLPRFDSDPEPRFVLDLAIALRERYHVTILAPADRLDKHCKEIDGVEIVRYRYAPFKSWETLAYPGAIVPRLKQKPWLWPLVPMLATGLFLALRRLLRNREFDLVHCHWFVPQGAVQAVGFSRPPYPPFIVTSHGGDLTSLNRKLTRFITRRIVNRAAAITVVSQQLVELLDNCEARAMVIPMGVDLDRFNTVMVPAVSNHKKIVLFVGRLAEKKGVNFLVDAMTALSSDIDCQLIIAGDGPDRAKLEEQARQLGVASSVSFLGAIDHKRLPELYSQAHVFCAPSIVAKSGDSDGLPTVLLEASACGTPCVSTMVGGINDFIVNDVNGLLVEAGDSAALGQALRRILNDDELRTRLSLQAQRSAQDYAWPVIARRFAAVYDNCLQGSVSHHSEDR